jgi:nitrite reductase/ring-hydroxylating ferredoxin subunit
MQSFDTDDRHPQAALPLSQTIVVGRVEDLPVESRKTVELPNERELALYNIDGEIYAIENFCPHKGAH